MPAPRTTPPTRLAIAAVFGALGVVAAPRASASRPLSDDALTSLLVPPEERTGPRAFPERSRPEPQTTRACSFRRRVCVHPSSGAAADEGEAVRALAAAERILDAYRVLDLPAPLGDEGRGGDDALDIYLDRAHVEPIVTRDPPKLGAPFDAASAFIEIAPPPAGPGCYFDSALAQAIGAAVVAGIDAGASEPEVRLEASYLAAAVAPCSVRELEGLDAAQRSPERGLGGVGAGFDGHTSFASLLDATYASASPSGALTTLLQLAGQRTQPVGWRFSNEPDLFDALRFNAADQGTSLGAQLLDDAVERGLYARSGPGAWAREGTPRLGQARLEWAVPYASLPRRLAPLRPIAPTGATYLWVDLTGAPPDAKLAFVADWELPVLLRWSLVKVGVGGTLEGRLDVAALFGKSHAEQTLLNVGGLAGVLVVGVNDGDNARDLPYDPDEAPHEAHGYEVTLYP